MFFKKKESAFTYKEGFDEIPENIVAVDEKLLESEDKHYLDKVRALSAEKYSLVEVFRLKKELRLFVLEDLENGSKNHLDSAREEAAQLVAEREKLAENYKDPEVGYVDIEEWPEPETAAAEHTCTEEKVLDDSALFDEPDSDIPIDSTSESIPIEEPKWFEEGEKVSHAQRLKRSKDNLKTVLDWVRIEPYTTAAMMSLVLGIGVPGARKALNKFVRNGWLVRDEVAWVGVSGKMHLFGVSTRGLYHLLDPRDVQPQPNGYFKRGRTKPNSGSHQLNLQLARLYLERIYNEKGEYRPYRRENFLPHWRERDKDLKHEMWGTYPDAIIGNSHIGIGSGELAIEIEQIWKSRKRYANLIKLHMQNIGCKRYDSVIYFLENRDEANNLKRVFQEEIAKQHVMPEQRDNVINRFYFDTYSDLDKRILHLH